MGAGVAISTGAARTEAEVARRARAAKNDFIAKEWKVDFRKKCEMRGRYKPGLGEEQRQRRSLYPTDDALSPVYGQF